jgi:hypothetical protein
MGADRVKDSFAGRRNCIWEEINVGGTYNYTPPIEKRISVLDGEFRWHISGSYSN